MGKDGTLKQRRVVEEKGRELVGAVRGKGKGERRENNDEGQQKRRRVSFVFIPHRLSPPLNIERKTHQDVRQHFHPPSLSTLLPDHISQLVDRERLRDRVGLGEGELEVVESVGDGGVLHDVALV